MRVKAIKKGYDGKQIREPGAVFEFEGKLGSWMEVVDEKKKAPGAPPAELEVGGEEPSVEAPADSKAEEKAAKEAEKAAEKAAKAAEKAAKKKK
jgi:hypothetical protein